MKKVQINFKPGMPIWVPQDLGYRQKASGRKYGTIASLETEDGEVTHAQIKFPGEKGTTLYSIGWVKPATEKEVSKNAVTIKTQQLIAQLEKITGKTVTLS